MPHFGVPAADVGRCTCTLLITSCTPLLFTPILLQRHGNARYGSPVEAPKAWRSRQGKMEKSLITFAGAGAVGRGDALGVCRCGSALICTCMGQEPKHAWAMGRGMIAADTCPTGVLVEVALTGVLAASADPQPRPTTPHLLPQPPTLHGSRTQRASSCWRRWQRRRLQPLPQPHLPGQCCRCRTSSNCGGRGRRRPGMQSWRRRWQGAGCGRTAPLQRAASLDLRSSLRRSSRG